MRIETTFMERQGLSETYQAVVFALVVFRDPVSALVVQIDDGRIQKAVAGVKSPLSKAAAITAV
jgi:hypothetical protein